MIFFLQMRWNIENRLSFKEVWDLEIEEGKAAQSGFKIVGMYKVAGQRRVIAIVDIPSADDLDRTIMGHLPLREYLEFEAICREAVREFSRRLPHPLWGKGA